MRKTIGILALFALAGCNGSAASASSEEQRAADLMHGLKDGLVLGQAALKLTSPSPATFVGEHGKDKIIFTVTKVGKCKYQTYMENPGLGQSMKVTEDLTGLVATGYPEHQPQRGMVRQLKGSVNTCETAQAGGCAEFASGETLFAAGDITGADLDKMVTDFRKDFCQ